MFKKGIVLQRVSILSIFGTFIFIGLSCSYKKDKHEPWGEWYRPSDNPVFTINHGNNHDPVLFVDSTLEYPYHLIIGGWGCTPENDDKPQTYLWRSKSFSWSSNDWELVSDNYKIGCYYEYDDGLKIGDKYYIYEEGIVFTYEGPLEEASGNWKEEGAFPKKLGDDIGVFYENGIFHLFGEYGNFSHGPDGTSLSHLTSKTGLGDWVLEDTLAVNPNPNGGDTFGVGDATIIKIGEDYYLYCDIESEGTPYRIMAWKSSSLYERFKKLSVAISPRENETDDWDNYRIQDGDIAYIPEIMKYVMVCNMKDVDGNPGGNFPKLKNATRVVGFFYNDDE